MPSEKLVLAQTTRLPLHSVILFFFGFVFLFFQTHVIIITNLTMLMTGFLHFVVFGCIQLCNSEESECFEFEHWRTRLHGPALC